MLFWTLITPLGDAGLMVPTAIAIAIWLYVEQSKAAAVLWLGLFASAGVLVTITKIAFLGFGIGIHRLNFTGISGHSMMSMSVYPVALLILSGATGKNRWIPMSAGMVFALIVAISRVKIGVHSYAEIFAGATLGAMVATSFALVPKPKPARQSNRMQVISLGLVVIFLAGYGRPAPSQDLVTRLALVVSGRETPYTKQEWWADGRRKISAPETVREALIKREPV